MPHRSLLQRSRWCADWRKIAITKNVSSKRFANKFVLIAAVVAMCCIPFLFRHQPLETWQPFQPDNISSQSSVVTIVESTDPLFAQHYKSQIRSVQCYARRHGYGYVFLDLRDEVATPICVKLNRDYHFRKHCEIAQWLRTKSPDSIAVVLDADVIAGTSNWTLDTWLRYDFDLAFYERSWNFEVASGNYIVRNTRFSRMFMHHWVTYEKIMPPGFSSTDNGAIHLAILDVLGIQGRELCRDLYRNLSADVTDLGPYYEFVACTKALLGPPRTYTTRLTAHDDLITPAEVGRRNESDDGQKVVGKVVIFPRFFGFVVDAMVYGISGTRNLHPFHHGLKNANWKDSYLDTDARGRNSGCRTFTENSTISDEEMGSIIRQSDHFVLGCREGPFARVPRWGHLDEGCYARLWCGPLEEEPKIWPNGMFSQDGKLQSLGYQRPEVDAYNLFATRAESSAGDEREGTAK